MAESGTESVLAGVSLSEVSLNVEEMGGSGEPIIVMHGWGQSLESMRLLGDLLAKFYHVYLIDLPGFGKSNRPSSDWDTVQYAECIGQYIKERGIAPVHVIGHSFGGRVSIRLASRHAELVESMILINSGGLRGTLTGKRKLRASYIKLLNRLCKTADRLFASKLYEEWYIPRFASSDYKNAGALKNILVKAVNEDVSEDAARIKAPALMLWGEADQETPVEIGQRLNSLVKQSKLVVMPGKDHFPFIDEGAHLCASYILKFLDGLKEARRAAPKSSETTSWQNQDRDAGS